MTIAERGQLLGGLSENLEPYGEVYSDYEGIASARPWASKESLKTHFNKQVYFTARVIPKTFRYDEKVTAGRELSNDRAGTIHISAGTRYRADYDVSEAVPTGEPLCINGLADSFKYKIVFDKVQIDFYIPVKLIVNYDIEWKGYDGGDRAEKKSITKWYYVKRTVSYYTLKQLDLSYLTAIAVSNYAFEGNGIRENIQGCRPSIDSQRYGAYYYHVTFPEYEDVLYVDGGELKENEWGAGSWRDSPDSGSTRCLEKWRSLSSPLSSIATEPLPRLRAVITESLTRFVSPSAGLSLSTTSSMKWPL